MWIFLGLVAVVNLVVIVWIVLFISSLYRSPGSIDSLDKLIDQADHIVVCRPVITLSNFDNPHPPPQPPLIIYESSNRKDMNALKTAIHINLLHFLHCEGCVEDPQIKLYREGKLIGSISSLYSVGLRCREVWSGDVDLSDPDAWKKWFTDRGLLDFKKGEVGYGVPASKLETGNKPPSPQR